ncbi:MAG TPA: class F sortase, partial [Candidatus Nanopelagicales bacterium]
QPGAAEDPVARSALPVPAGSIPLRDATRIEPLDERDPPRRLSIPSVEVDMPVAAAGVLADGQMDLPEDPREVGWYRFGPGPGEERGSVVLGGHVDSTRYGVGPLARLASVEVGARIVVTDATGTDLRYRVTSVERISKAALPTQRLFDPDSAPRLVVITCGGRYLPEAGGYEDNIVVLARPA